MAAIDLLILDDLGLHTLRHDEPTDLYELIRVRDETGAIVITSNRDIEEWPPLFGDALLPARPWDRLLHHAHIIDIKGESYRNPRSKRRSPKAATRRDGSGLPNQRVDHVREIGMRQAAGSDLPNSTRSHLPSLDTQRA